MGPNSLGAVTAIRCQAEVLQELGKLDDALERYQDCADRCRKTEGESSLEYAAVLCGWASCLDDTNDFELAGDMYKECMGTRKLLLGEAHPEYADTLNNFAVHLQMWANNPLEEDQEQSQCMYKKAIETLEKCCQITETCFGKMHPDYAASLANLANCIKRMYGDGKTWDQARLIRALGLYSEAVDLSGKAAENQSWQTGKLMSDKAACLTAMGEFK